MSEYIFLRKTTKNAAHYHAVNAETMRAKCSSNPGRGGWHQTPGEAVTCPQCVKALAGIWTKNDPTAESWAAMKNRCRNPSHPKYANYGGRGIKVCDRWAGRDGLRYFIEDMGRRPEGMTLDRIDPDGDYTPENCRWADWKTQMRNRRNVPKMTAFGQTRTFPEWCELFRAKRGKVRQRMERYGWTLEEALTMEAVQAPGDHGTRGGWKRVPRTDLPSPYEIGIER